MHKLHGMGSQSQAFAKPVWGGRGMGLLPQPVPLHRGPKTFSAKEPAVEGWVRSTQHVSTGAAMPWLTRLLLRPAWQKPPKTAVQQEPGPAPCTQPYPRHTLGELWAWGKGRRGAPQELGKIPHYVHRSVMLSYKFFQGSLRGDLTVHRHTNLLFLWTLG